MRNIVGLGLAASLLVASGMARPVARRDDDAQDALNDLAEREAAYRQRLIERDADAAKRKRDREAQEKLKRLSDDARSAEKLRLAAEKRGRKLAKRAKEQGGENG